MRHPLVMANWKMNGSLASVAQLTAGIKGYDNSGEAEVALCPSFVHLPAVLADCAGSAISVGGQDCSHMHAGAYTGEIAPDMLADLGCRWVLLGHSERRQYHAESDALIAAKLSAAMEAGLTPVLCIGETREQREEGEAYDVVSAQLKGALSEQSSLTGLVIAYEPVWAIGTGLTASPEEAQEMHQYIRSCLSQFEGVIADATRVLYGGSVKAANASALFAQPDIDGALVGGAALDSAEFKQIIAAAG